MFGNQVLFIYGLYYTSSTVASIFQPLIPVLTTAFALILRIEQFKWKDRYSWMKVWAICTSGGGAIIMVMAKGKINTQSDAFIGYLLLLGNTSSMAIYVLLQKKYLFFKDEFGREVSLYPCVSACAWSYGMGALLMGISAIPYGIVKPTVFEDLNLQFVYPLIYAIFISSAMCYGLINYSTSKTSATVVTSFWPLQVPVATIESYFVFGEVPLWTEYVGGGFIIIGLIVVCYVKFQVENREKRAAPKINEDLSYR